MCFQCYYMIGGKGNLLKLDFCRRYGKSIIFPFVPLRPSCSRWKAEPTNSTKLLCCDYERVKETATAGQAQAEHREKECAVNRVMEELCKPYNLAPRAMFLLRRVTLNAHKVTWSQITSSFSPTLSFPTGSLLARSKQTPPWAASRGG